MAKDIDFDALFQQPSAPKEGDAGGSIDFDGLFGQKPYVPEPSTERTWGQVGKDAAIKFGQGVVETADAATGLVNLATFGGVRKAQQAMGLDPDAGPKLVKRLGEGLYKGVDGLSPQQQQAEQNVSDAKGFTGTVKALADNPLAITGGILESVPSLILPAGAARGAVGAIVNRVVERELAAGATREAAELAGRKALEEVGSKVKVAWATHAGEGALSAGQIAQQALEANPDDPSKMYWGVPAGVATAAIGRLAGKIPGMGDAEVALFSGVKGAGATGNYVTRVAKGVVQEGALEEAPQSASEQVFQNLGTNKPAMEGVGEAAGQGLVVGGAMGGAFAGVHPAVHGAGVETPSAPVAADAINAAVDAQAAAPAPTASQGFVRNAFADVGGAEDLQETRKADRGTVALSLSQIEQHDGKEGLAAAIEHLAAGDQAAAEQLYAASQDPELIAAGKQALGNDAMKFIQVNDAIRTDAGLTDHAQQPAINTQAEVPAETGTVPATPQAPAQIPHLQAQVSAVRDGLLHGAVIDPSVAPQLDLNGLQHGFATAEDGSQYLVVATDAQTVQSGVARVTEVGPEQAAAELGQPVQGKAVIADSTGERAVTPQEAGAIQPDASTQVRTVDEALQDRAAQLPEPLQAPEPEPAQEQFVRKEPTFFGREGAPQKKSTPVKFAPVKSPSGHARRLVERLNASLGLDGDQAVSHLSMVEVQPAGPLQHLAAAMSSAFGVKLVFVHAPQGLVRNSGQQFNHFNGVADRSNKVIVANVEANIPLNMLGHELAHILETEHPEVYDKLELTVLSRMRHAAAAELRDKLNAAVKSESNQDAMSAAEFRSEVVAEAIGEMAEDSQFWRDVFGHIGEEQTLAKAFYQKVLDVIAKLQRALTKAGYVTGIKDVATVKKAVTEAYKAWAKDYEFTGGNPTNLTAEGIEMLGQFRAMHANEVSQEKRRAAKEAKAVEETPESPPAAEKPVEPPPKNFMRPEAGEKKLRRRDIPVDAASDETKIEFQRKEPEKPTEKELGYQYGRAGEVETNQRWKSGARKGQYIGAPTKYNTPAKIAHLRKLFHALAKEGESGRYWYESSGIAVLKMVGGDVKEARKFVALLAIYSPQAKVDSNSTFALRAWAQYKAGDKTISVKTRYQDEQAERVLFKNENWGGEKTNNFYRNLMREIDAVAAHAKAQGVTVDMWMMRAAGYHTDVPTEAAYRFVENETNRLAAELGWEPQQVQAAIWVAMKARTEDKGVKKKTIEQSIKKGYSHYGEKVNKDTGKKSKQLVVTNQAKHRELWLDNALALHVTESGLNDAKFDFSDGLRRNMGQVSWEARPGRSTGVLPGVNDAPYQQQAEFQMAIAEALTGPNGEDLLANRLGLMFDGRVLAPGVWQSEVAAGMQNMFAMAPQAGGGLVDPAQHKLMDTYASILGLLLHQEGVGWHRPFYSATKQESNGVDLRIGRPLEPHEAQAFYDELKGRLPAGLVMDENVGLISTPEGIRAIHFEFKPEDGAAVESWHQLNRDFQAAVNAAAEVLPDSKVAAFASDGNLVTNDWKENPDGQSYRHGASAAGRSDVLQWAAGVLAPRVQAVFDDFSKRYNWGEPGKPISFSRAEGRGAEATPADVGTHYGRVPGLNRLSGSSFGTGIRGAEQARLNLPGVDSRIKQRVYFYLPVEGGLPQPEAGLGQHVYQGKLSNLYDADKATQAERDRVRGLMADNTANSFESAVLDAGYEGYTNREQGTAVVLGRNVPVQYRGTMDQHKIIPRKIERAAPRVETRQEGDELVRRPQGAEMSAIAKNRAKLNEVAPSFRLEYGEARIKPEDKEAANKAMSEAGSEFAFQRRPLKMESVQDVLDFTKTGDLKLDLTDALDRSAWADAYVQAKNPDQRKSLLRKLGDWTIESFADSKIKVSRWIEGLPLSNNVRQQLEGDLRRSDTMRSALEKEVKQRFTEPMFKAIHTAAKASKLSSDQVKKMAGYWMTAKYAPEANAQLIRRDRAALRSAQAGGDPVEIAKAQQDLAERLADVNGAIGAPKVRGVAGGMNDAEAAQVLKNIESKIDRKHLDAIAAPIYEMMEWKKQSDLSVGKVTQTMVNSWLNSTNYVPLTGDPRADRESRDVFSSGNAVNQADDKQMMGRKDSVADDGIDAAFEATIKSINFAAMQDFKRTLNDAYEQAQASGQDIGLTREPISGLMRNSDDVIIYRDKTQSPNGLQSTTQHAFKFKDERIMQAIKRDNQESVNSILSAIAAPTRWYARAVTQFMPMFAPINLVRDIWERTELLRAKKLYADNGQLIDVKKAARASIADVINRDLWKASMMHAFKKGGMNPVRGELEEFIRLGGSSTIGAYLDRTSGNLEASLRGWNSKTGHARDVILHRVEAYNDMFEVIPSLAIYRSLKAQGMSAKNAAAATLDLMNFRKRGTMMAPIKALYVFAQPAATGGYNLAKYLATPTGRIRFAAQVLVGTAVYALLKAAWGDDEDDPEIGNKLDNLNNFTVERSLPVKLGGLVLKIPVGFGAPQLAWQVAGIINRFASGRYNAADAAGELVKGWAKNFAPMNPSEMEMSKRPVDFWVQTFTPTIMAPLFQIYADQTAFGTPLTPVFKDRNKLKSEQALRTTPQAYTDIAKELHDTFGIDMYPDHIKALANGFLVGPIREILSMGVDNDAKAMRGEPPRLPLVHSLIDSDNERQRLNSVYYRVRGDMEQGHREFTSMQADPERRGSITPEQMQQEREYRRFQAAEKVIGMQRSALRKAKGLDDEQRATKTQEIEERADATRRRLLAPYLRDQKAARQ